MKQEIASNSLDGLTKLINKYYFSTNYTIVAENTLQVVNTKTLKIVGKVEVKKNRYYFIII